MSTIVTPAVPVASFNLVDGTTSTQIASVDVGGAELVSSGGSSASAVAANSANSVVKATAGRLCRVLVTTLGSNATVIYDNATAGSGTVIGYVVASAAAGTLYDFQTPAANGITIKGDTARAAVTVSWS